VAALQSRGAELQAAREIYQKIADSYRSRPDPDLSGVRGVLESLPEERAKKVRPESLIDPVPWERVAKSGFLEKLYGRKESALRSRNNDKSSRALFPQRS
jgi:hypothetical protein